MDTPSPRPPPATLHRIDEQQVLRWLKLRRELTELHARLEYLKLMMSLGVAR